MIEPFLSAIPVLKKLKESGFEAYFVGGSVRDYLLGSPISDVDIATSATPEEVKQVFMKTVDIGIEHGTVLVLFKNNSYEITTFRAESEYLDYRRPKEVAFIRSLKEDLKRRDFTMNAIAMDADGQLIDPYNGKSAIRTRIIQTVGCAKDRFEEDALRMMRAVRFVSQLSFEMDKETRMALTTHAHLLDKIAIERKRVEFEKLLIGKNRKTAIEMLIETGLFSFLPSLHAQKNNLQELLSFDIADLNLNEMWSLLIFCMKLKGKTIETFLRNWRLPLKQLREIQNILVYLDQRFDHEWTSYDLYSAKYNTILSVEKLFLVIQGLQKHESVKKWLTLYEELPIKKREEIDVTGNDLMSWFNQAGGPWLKETLFSIEQAILDKRIVNEKSKIKEWLMECNQN